MSALKKRALRLTRSEVRALRDVSSEQVKKSDCPRYCRVALRILSGKTNVSGDSLDLLAEDDGSGVGALMNESHESSRNNFDNSSPELNLLVEIARGMPGVLGARLTGAGFGGATVTLCEEKRAEHYCTRLGSKIRGLRKLQARTFVCKIGGARTLA
jgi:galactokinase